MPPLTGPNFSDAEFGHQRAIAGDVFGSQISFEATALADEDHKASEGVEVFAVRLEMFRDLLDPGMHDGNLDFGRPSVALSSRITRDYLTLNILIQRHSIR